MYWPALISGIRKRTRTRPPSSGATVASSRRVMKAGPSTPVKATLAMTRDHSPVLSSARSILVSGTRRTRQPSESRICLTALAPGASLSRTRRPTWRGPTVGLVLTILIIESRPPFWLAIKGLRRIGQLACGKGRWLASSPVLLSNGEACAAEIALNPGTVPENPERSRRCRGNHAGIEHLEAITRPFRRAAPVIRGTKNRAALRTHFIEEEACGQPHGIFWGASRSRNIVGGKQ